MPKMQCSANSCTSCSFSEARPVFMKYSVVLNSIVGLQCTPCTWWYLKMLQKMIVRSAGMRTCPSRRRQPAPSHASPFFCGDGPLQLRPSNRVSPRRPQPSIPLPRRSFYPPLTALQDRIWEGKQEQKEEKKPPNEDCDMSETQAEIDETCRKQQLKSACTQIQEVTSTCVAEEGFVAVSRMLKTFFAIESRAE